MEILQTKRQIENEQFPTKLDVLRELEKRGVIDAELASEFHRLKRGAAGEKAVLNFLQEFGADYWGVVKNMWFKHFGAFECDLLLITKSHIHPIEIKNYTGVVEFRESQCLVNGKKTGHNPITQAQRVTTNIEQIMQSSTLPLNIQGTLIFIGQHNEVLVHDSVNNLKIIRSNQLRNYIWQLVKEEQKYYGIPINKHEVVRHLEHFETDNPFTGHEISDEIKKQVRLGICCSHCGSFDVDTGKSYVSCECGMYEPRENAIVRTICEYGVIYFDKELNTTELFNFFGGSISRRTLQKYLNNYFTMIGAGRGSKYLNLKLPFDQIQHLFKFKRSSYLRL